MHVIVERDLEALHAQLVHLSDHVGAGRHALQHLEHGALRHQQLQQVAAHEFLVDIDEGELVAEQPLRPHVGDGIHEHPGRGLDVIDDMGGNSPGVAAEQQLLADDHLFSVEDGLPSDKGGVVHGV